MSDLNDLAKRIAVGDRKLRHVVRMAPYLYRRIVIPKKDGSFRTLWIPRGDLKEIQKKLLISVFGRIKLPPYLHGGVPKKSIITNAKSHLRKSCVVCLDLRDYFPSIHRTKLEKVLRKYFDPALLSVVVRLVTHKHCLPQGAPTSPYISNLVFLDHDAAIASLCGENHLTYTRYFDDLTISGKHAERMIPRILEVIQRSGFRVNKRKLLVQLKEVPQFVTGLMVNRKLAVSQEVANSTNNMVTNIERLGMQAFQTEFPLKEIDSLRGKISFIQQIDKGQGFTLITRLEKVLKDLGI